MITTHVLPALRPHAIAGELDTYLHRVGTWLQEACCSLHGHDLLLHFEQGRVCLKCANCGRETAGWTIDRRLRTPPTVMVPITGHHR
jgi:hypothetical protein